MVLDSVRILTDSASHLWQRLVGYGSLETLPTSSDFEDWAGSMRCPGMLNQIEELQLRRDYRRLRSLLIQIAALVHSQSRALELVRTQADEIDE